jgi:Protein of unknown function (DUF2844)
MRSTFRLRSRALGTALGAILITGAMTLPAFAALGGDAASVAADAAKMKGQARATASGGYTVSEITLPSGTVVREYVSAEGKVFAVTWKGMTPPDLQQTLGTYFEQYKAAAAAAPRQGHHHRTVRNSDLVVSTSGHMRALRGAAYVPSLLPPNFPLNDIK